MSEWRKVGKNQWNKGHINLAVEPDGKSYILMLEDFKNEVSLFHRKFKTEAQAIKYAMSYMRKN